MNTVTANNKTVVAYNALFEAEAELQKELREIQARIDGTRDEQRELVEKRIRNLAEIGQRVFRKCIPDYYAVPNHKAKEILGELGWIYGLGKFVKLNGHSIQFEGGSMVREFLHMSDRDFAKLIRQKVRVWKDAQKAERIQAEAKSLESARKAVEEAQRVLLKAEKAAEEIEAAERRAEAKLQAKAEHRAKREAELKG